VSDAVGAAASVTRVRLLRCLVNSTVVVGGGYDKFSVVILCDLPPYNSPFAVDINTVAYFSVTQFLFLMQWKVELAIHCLVAT
jgi:hypothetical protein